MGPAKSKDAGDTHGSERVQAISVSESLVFGCRLLRIAGTAGRPVMVLDASNHRTDFVLWKTTLGEHLCREHSAPLRVISSTGPVPNVMQQRSGFNYLGIGACNGCNANR
jgi:hypothetical protein